MLQCRPARPQPDEVEFDATKGKWTLARLGGEPLDPHRSLAEFTIYDGEVLVIREIGMPSAPLLFDDLEVDVETVDTEPADAGRLVRDAPLIAVLRVGVVASVTAALLLAGPAVHPLDTAIAAALAVGAAGHHRRLHPRDTVRRRTQLGSESPWLAAMAMPLIFAGSLHIVPDGSAASSLPMAFALTGFAALVMLLMSRPRPRAAHRRDRALGVRHRRHRRRYCCGPPRSATIGAIIATASVIVVYLAPRVTILLSKLPIPRVPTAGEPLDDIETQGGTTVEGVNAIGKQIIPTEEGMIERVRPSNQYLTGIVAAATLTAIVGSYLAIDVSNGFFWQGAAFAIAVATVLCLRGRSHYDLVQSATLIGGGLLIGVGAHRQDRGSPRGLAQSAPR